MTKHSHIPTPHEVKLANTLRIEEIIKNKKFHKLDRFGLNLNHSNEYQEMLKKTNYQMNKINYIKNRNKIKLFFVGIVSTYCFYSIAKFLLVANFIFMYDFDIRKPAVSDFFIERFS